MTVELTKDNPVFRLRAGTRLNLIEERPNKALLSLDGRQGWFLKDEYTALGRARMHSKVVKDSETAGTESTEEGQKRLIT